MNEHWKKETTMSLDDKFNLHEYRISKLEESHKEMRQDIRDIKELVVKMDKRLSTIPEGGLQCGIHQVRMQDFEKRVEAVEVKTDSLNKKIITWTAVASVVLFLLSQVAIPYALEHYKVAKNAEVTIYDPSPAAYFGSLQTNGYAKHQ